MLRAFTPPGGGGGGGISGSGTAGTLAKFTGATALGDSLLSESGTTITSAATAETFGGAQTWTFGAPNAFALIVKSNAGPESTLVLDTISRAVGIGGAPGTLLHVQDAAGYPFAGSTYAGVRLQRSTEALFSASDYTRSFRAGLTGSTAVVGTSTAHDLLLQRGNVTALTLGASGAVAFAGDLTSNVAQTWTLASSTTALNIQSGLLNLDTTNSRVGIGTASPQEKLQVYGDLKVGVLASGSYISLGDEATTNRLIGIFRAPGDTLLGVGGYAGIKFTVGAASLGSQTERMRIDATGNVGIGTASPTGRLHVVGGTAAAATNGAPVTIIAQSAGTGNQNGGNIVLTPGALSGTGSAGVADLSGPPGTGLKLPATPGNTDAQTLDCYQENPLATTAGNGWTPTLSAAATWGGTQPNVTYARYVRMGSMVFCEVTLAMGAGTMTSTYPLTTITSPFTTNANANYSAVPVAAAGASGVGFQTGTTVYLPTIGASSTFILAWSFFA